MKVDPSDIDVVKIDVAQRAHSARHTHAHPQAAKHTELETKGKGVSFADQLKTATKKATSKQPAATKKDPNKVFLSHTPPKGETTAAVAGHTDYRDILSGPRNGMYVNTSGNERNRTPVASKIALPMAGATPSNELSPAPAEGISLRSISTVSNSGTSLNRGSR